MTGMKIPTQEMIEAIKHNYGLMVNTLEDGLPLNKVNPRKFTFVVRASLQRYIGKYITNWYVHVRLTKDTVETKLELIGSSFTNYGMATAVFATKFDRSKICSTLHSTDSGNPTSSGTAAPEGPLSAACG